MGTYLAIPMLSPGTLPLPSEALPLAWDKSILKLYCSSDQVLSLALGSVRPPDTGDEGFFKRCQEHPPAFTIALS